MADPETLPWLEPVEDEGGGGDRPGRPPRRAALVAAAALLLALVAAGAYIWLTRDVPTAGDGRLIAAPAGPYKVRPDDPGGMTVEGEGDTAFAASEGDEPRGSIDLGAVPEQPMTPADAAPAAAAAPAAEGDSSIQLGAFSSEASAQKAWSALSGRFAYLAPLTHVVAKVESEERTLYRLRATGPGARGICGRLRIAGETCLALD